MSLIIPAFRGIPASVVNIPAFVSASVRARQSTAGGIGTGSSPFNAFSCYDRTNVAVANPSIMVVNGYRSPSTSLEVAGTGYLYYAHAVITDPVLASHDQTGKTLHWYSFSRLLADQTVTWPNGTAGYACRDATGALKTYAEFVTAGGSVTTVDATSDTVVIPSGWAVVSDPVAFSLSAGQTYLNRLVAAGPASTSGALQCTVSGNGTTDWKKTAASRAASIVATLDWSASSPTSLNGTGSGSLAYPAVIFGTGAAGVKTVGVDGDSLTTGEPGDFKGGNYNEQGWVKRALTIQGYSFVGTSVPSSRAFPVNAAPTSTPFRNIILGMCHAVITDHFRNETGAGVTTWGDGTTASPNGDGKLWSIMRSHVQNIRTYAKGGARVVYAVPFPQQNSGGASGGTAISAITSSSTVATATVASSASLTVGQYIQIGASDVAGYEGNVQVASKPDSTHFTFTIPNGGSDLSAATTAKYALHAGAAVYPTAAQYTDAAPWLNRTGSYTGPFNTAAGDPDTAIDVYTLADCSFGFYRAFDDLQDGIHPRGRATTDSTYVPDIATAVAPLLANRLGF